MKSNEIGRSDVSPSSVFVVVEFKQEAKGFKQDVKEFISKCVERRATHFGFIS